MEEFYKLIANIQPTGQGQAQPVIAKKKAPKKSAPPVAAANN